MMSFCLSKLKSFSHKFKIIDSSFIFTEPHSRVIKIKITIQKELDKNLVTQDVIINYKEENILCRDCQKLQTPHIWCAKVQIRQKVPHKKTFMYLEQYILKNKMQEKAMNIQEVNEGVDFYFGVKRDAEVFTDFISPPLAFNVPELEIANCVLPSINPPVILKVPASLTAYIFSSVDT